MTFEKCKTPAPVSYPGLIEPRLVLMMFTQTEQYREQKFVFREFRLCFKLFSAIHGKLMHKLQTALKCIEIESDS